MDWIPHVPACIQGTYVVCSRIDIQWCWGMYLLRGEIKWLVVEWSVTLIEFHQNYDDFNCFDSYSGCLECGLSNCSVVQTEHILQTIKATTNNGYCCWALDRYTAWENVSRWILQASLLSFFPFLWNITWEDLQKSLPWMNNKSTVKRL